MTKATVFGDRWLDSVYLQTTLPDSPWFQCHDTLAAQLAEKVKSQFGFPERKQMILELLGDDFIQRYLSDIEEQPHILQPPRFNETHLQKLSNEARSWLKYQIDQIDKELRESHPDKYQTFRQHVIDITSTAVNRHVYVRKTANPKAIASDIMSESVVAILKRDPQRLRDVTHKLVGRQLPVALRKHLWATAMFRPHMQNMDHSSVEKILRERFVQTFRRNADEMNLTAMYKSPINNLIENAVIETYEKTASLTPIKGEMQLRITIQTLNAMYIYGKKYEPHFIYWLAALALAFKEANPTDEGICDLALYLNLFSQHCFPSWNEVISITEKVMAALAAADPDLFNHLQRISKINPQVNQKEFMKQLILDERHITSATPSAVVDRVSVLADPILFIRKWIAEGWVSVLFPTAFLFVWDQLFLMNWSSQALINISTILVMLLKFDFMTAQNYTEMRKIFLESPRDLLTLDVLRAIRHSNRGGKLSDIPYFNRRSAFSRDFPDEEAEIGQLTLLGDDDDDQRKTPKTPIFTDYELLTADQDGEKKQDGENGGTDGHADAADGKPGSGGQGQPQSRDGNAAPGGTPSSAHGSGAPGTNPAAQGAAPGSASGSAPGSAPGTNAASPGANPSGAGSHPGTAAGSEVFSATPDLKDVPPIPAIHVDKVKLNLVVCKPKWKGDWPDHYEFRKTRLDLSLFVGQKEVATQTVRAASLLSSSQGQNESNVFSINFPAVDMPPHPQDKANVDSVILIGVVKYSPVEPTSQADWLTLGWWQHVGLKLNEGQPASEWHLESGIKTENLSAGGFLPTMIDVTNKPPPTFDDAIGPGSAIEFELSRKP